GKAFATAKRAPRVVANHAGDAKIWATDMLALGTGARVGVVSIKQFPFHEDPIWSSFDEAIRATLKHEAVIVDLRGNDGGDDTRGYQLARALIDGEVVDGPLRMHERQTPETLTLWMNTVSAQRGDDGTLAPHVLARLNEAKAARDAALHAGNEWKVTESPKRVVELGPHAFTGPIAILVDAGCKSSCESSLVVLRGHPKARVFGERTGGYIHFGNIGRVTLARSHVRVNIPTKYDEFPGGKLYDKIGFEPDVALPPGSDAFAVALEWIRGSLGGSAPGDPRPSSPPP
ncbi:MAG TPA: S41 family peptidase, partial [Polyangiaceae bacterium]